MGDIIKIGILAATAIIMLAILGNMGGCTTNYCPATNTQLDTFESVGVSK